MDPSKNSTLRQKIREMSKEELLAQLLAKELGYYRAALELARTTLKQLEEEISMTTILSGVQKRKILLSCIDEIEGAIEPLKRHWAQRSQRDGPHAEEVRATLRKIAAIIEEMMRIEKVCEPLLKRRMRISQARQ